MKTDNIQYSKVSFNNNWSAEYNIYSKQIYENFNKFLNKFKVKKIPLGEKFNLAEGSLDRCIVLRQNTFTYTATIENEYLRNGYHRIIGSNLTNNEISLEFLEWFLNQKEVKDLLALNSIGSIVRRIDEKKLKQLDIPILGRKFNKSIDLNEQFKSDFLYNDPYRNLLKLYTKEFYENVKTNNSLSSVVIAGSICELILFNLLDEQETVQKKYLHDRGLGTYIDYCRMLDLEKKISFRLQPFDEVKKIRNKIVHPSNAIKEMINPVDELVDLQKIENYIKEIIIDFGL